MSVGENLRRLREAANLSQAELARRVQVSAPMICQIERGTKAPSLLLGLALAAALDCDVKDLAFTDARPA